MIKLYKNHYDVRLQTLKLRDISGLPPMIFFTVSTMLERGVGKTYSTADTLLENYNKCGKYLESIIDHESYHARSGKFILVTRRISDLGAIANGIFTDLLKDKYPDYEVYEIFKKSKSYTTVILAHHESIVEYDKDGNPMEPKDVKVEEEVGWVVPINIKSDYFKRVGKKMYDADVFFFDEFQPTQNDEFLPHEVEKFITIYETVARGDGQPTRYIPCIFGSNCISCENPYFYYTGLTGKIQDSTKIYRGENCVYERVSVDGLIDTRLKSPAYRCFRRLFEEQGNNTYINDDKSLVCKTDGWGRAIYLCTLYDGQAYYGVHLYMGKNIYYISRNIDKQCKSVFALYVNENKLNNPVLSTVKLMRDIKKALFGGYLRVSDQGVQNMIRDYFT